MRKAITCICIALSGMIYAQFDAQISQYMLHQNAFNPAAVGEKNLIEIIGEHRINMISMPGAGSVSIFSVNSPVKFGTSTHGLGLTFINDRVGLFTNQSFHAQYAYKMKLGAGKLSAGLQLGVVGIGFSGDSLSQNKITLGSYHDISGDEYIPQTSVVGMKFDIGLGALYTLRNWYAGVSFLHLNQPVVKWGDKTEFKQYGMFYTSAGMHFQLSDPKFVLHPSVLIKSDFSLWQFDLSSRVEYDNRFWGGLTIRPFSSVVLMAGINIAGGFAISYSADVATSKLISSNYGSHEIMFAYSFEYVFSKKTTKQKSIRYL